ncbi:hypothetical protein AB0D08_29905, partial [Kitasatospora sp. NPDC048540]|uniref:hypothetical protein n=1 Tax=Kitasatospora sp. NPDC048540 TaxID=3155634 RepID=UPI0033D657BD
GLGRGARIAYLGRESEHYYDLAVGCAKGGAATAAPAAGSGADPVPGTVRGWVYLGARPQPEV